MQDDAEGMASWAEARIGNAQIAIDVNTYTTNKANGFCYNISKMLKNYRFLYCVAMARNL